MLLNLHVKNIALIRETDIDFSDGLNILSGETGAGKSLLLGSLNIALGSRMPQDLIRHGESEAFVELVFSVTDERTEELLSSMGVETDDGMLIISRRIVHGKTVSRMNGVAVTASDIKKAAASLLDIHGQHENQTLLKAEKQLAILDEFGADEVAGALQKTGELYRAYREIGKKLSEYDMDEAARLREESLLLHETEEIRLADIGRDEEEELEALYRKMVNSRKIIEACEAVRVSLGDENGALELVGRAARELSPVLDYDDALGETYGTLSEVESLLYDVNREIASCMDGMNFSENDFEETGKRLDQIHTIMAKYGGSYDEIQKYLSEAEERLEFLRKYEESRQKLTEEAKRIEARLKESCAALSDIRKKTAARFCEAVVSELRDLNFNKVEFDVVFSQAGSYRADGTDLVSFHISMNPGEPIRPLSKVASGGELSRIMLAIRTILADRDRTGTLIFDEIDAGISGITAQRVAEKMALIAANRQLICVTHLAQIASMADSNYVIEKESDDSSTVTLVRPLREEEKVGEIARLLGGTGTDDPASENARDMIGRAGAFKESIRTPDMKPAGALRETQG